MYKPVRMMESGDLGALAFRGPDVNPAWLYYVVQLPENLEYGPWDQEDIIDISTNRVLKKQRPEDPLSTPNSEILYIDDPSPPMLLHGSIGLSPTFLKCYIQYTEGNAPRGQWPNLNPINPSADIGDYQVGFWGHQSTYDNPTTAGELWIPPRRYLALAFYNAGDFDVRPVCRFEFQKLLIRPLVPSGTEATADNRLIRKMAEAKLRYSRGHVGSMESLVAWPKELKWETELITEEKARTLPVQAGGV